MSEDAVIVDAHVHVWDPRVVAVPWIRAVDALDRAVTPAQYARASSAGATIFVEADAAPNDWLAEVDHVLGLDWPELVGIVAAVDMRAPDLRDRLSALQGRPRVVGVRHLLQDVPLQDFPAFAPGLRAVAAAGLVFDACVRHPQLSALADLIEEVPDARIVLDHLGKPPVNDGISSPAGQAWKHALSRLAAHPGTAVKLSGLAAEASSMRLLSANGPAYLAYALEAFGPARCMYGSDFPVSTTFGAAETVSDSLRRLRAIVAEAGVSETAVLSRTAVDWYRLTT